MRMARATERLKPREVCPEPMFWRRRESSLAEIGRREIPDLVMYSRRMEGRNFVNSLHLSWSETTLGKGASCATACSMRSLAGRAEVCRPNAPDCLQPPLPIRRAIFRSLPRRQRIESCEIGMDLFGGWPLAARPDLLWILSSWSTDHGSMGNIWS